MDRLSRLPYDRGRSSGRSRRTRPRSPSTSATAGEPTATRRFIRARRRWRSGSGAGRLQARARPGHSSEPQMTVTFADKLAADPALRARDLARRRQGARRRPPTRSSWPPTSRRSRRTPTVIEAIAQSRGGHQPLPGSGGARSPPGDRRPPRDRAGSHRRLQRLLRDPARRRPRALRARRRDPLRLALVLDLSVPARALRGAGDPGASSPTTTSTTSTRCSRRSRRPRSC